MLYIRGFDSPPNSAADRRHSGLRAITTATSIWTDSSPTTCPSAHHQGMTSVLIGPNALGGAINLVTKRSDEAVRWSVQRDYGTGGERAFDRRWA